jgi:hypothetical protein
MLLCDASSTYNVNRSSGFQVRKAYCAGQLNEGALYLMESSTKLQNETVTRLRSLAHDLTNSIETVMQASYLLGQTKLEEPNNKWLKLIDKATQDAARINREIREILRSLS